MFSSIVYAVFAILALSFLIFIHELGHYIMARRVGMKVETFAIGFGKPIYSWMYQGVKWQIGWILFGGYVKIAGQEIDDQKTPYQAPDGFFSKSPWDRIKVAFMGPFVNLAFALLAFSLIYVEGGRVKNFSEYSSIIGWVDPRSELFAKGIRPGDQIISYAGQSFQGSKDHLYAPMTAGDELKVKGYKVDSTTGDKYPYDIDVKPYSPAGAIDKGLKTSGILSSASYIVYDKLPNKVENPLPEGSPLNNSGIEYGDRIVWVDGHTIYSVAELNHFLNDNRSLLTIERNGQTILRRVPRVPVEELRLDFEVREELTDWQFESGLNGTKITKLFYIPYNLTNNAVVENRVRFIDADNEKDAFPTNPYSTLEEPLQEGDRIVAIDGIQIDKSFQLLYQLQQKFVHIIVDRKAQEPATSWSTADSVFLNGIDRENIQKIGQTIGTTQPITQVGDLHLLKPVAPKMMSQFNFAPEKQALIAQQLKEQKKEIENIQDPEKKAQALHLFQSKEKQLLIGLPGIQDKKVIYNPTPTELYSNVFSEIWRTLTALFTGAVNPKWVAGPIGIIQVVHDNWKVSFQEVLYWLGAISLNLGMLNLLPIPMLDGGTILFSLVEMVTGKKLDPKTLEKIILPFAILLIGFFVFLTYNDLSRILGNFL